MSYNGQLRNVLMATKKEYPQRYGWWINELSSLGIKPIRRNDINDRKEITDLTENIKQTLFQEYKAVYNK
jgi:hypothetical protein